MDIVQATPDDLETIVELEAVLFDNSFGEGTLRRELEVSYCAVMRDGMDIVVGYVIVRPNGELHDLLRLGVMPSFQRKGIGRRLLRHILVRFPGPMMLMVRRENPAALLYKAHDFQTVAMTDKGWVMRRDATSAAI